MATQRYQATLGYMATLGYQATQRYQATLGYMATLGYQATLGYMATQIILSLKIHGLAVVISLTQSLTKNGELVVFMATVMNWSKKHIRITKSQVIFIKRMSNLWKN